MVTPISVEPSLDLQLNFGSHNLSISTPSQLPLNIVVTLNTQGCHFLHDADLMVVSSIWNVTLTLQGALFDVNSALKQIVINLDDEDTQACGGVVTISDSLNPTFVRSYDDLSPYFKHNDAPNLNPEVSLQKQIGPTPLETGEFFSILLNESAFIGHNLKYNLTHNHSLG